MCVDADGDDHDCDGDAGAREDGAHVHRIAVCARALVTDWICVTTGALDGQIYSHGEYH